MNLSIEKSVREVIEKYRVPGIVLAVARGDGPVERLAVGTDAAGEPLAEDSLFPVASITKLATALAVLRLYDQAIIDLDAPLGLYLPDAAAAQTGVTLRKLLCHTSGVPIDLSRGAAPYAPGLTWAKLAEACSATGLERPPDTEVVYSNVGYGLLALVVERETSQAFPMALRDLVLTPLGIEAYLGEEPPRLPACVIVRRGQQLGSDLEPFNSAFYRSVGFPWAGMVTTVDGALTLARAFQGEPADFLKESTAREAVQNQVGELSGGASPLFWPHSPWGLGPDLHGEKSPHWAPPTASPGTFGHAGASGCVAYVDPVADVAWAFAGAHSAEGGWLLRGGAQIGAAILGG